MSSQREQSKGGPVCPVFAMPYLLQQVFQFLSPIDLILSYQFLSRSARASLHSENQFLRWSLKNIMKQRHISREGAEPANPADTSINKRPEFIQIWETAKTFIKAARHPSPIQCLAFRSTLGDRSQFQVYNLGLWGNRDPFCSRLAGEGVFTMIPFASNDKPFHFHNQMLHSLFRYEHPLLEKLGNRKPLSPQVEEVIAKAYQRRLREMGLEKVFKGSFQELRKFWEGDFKFYIQDWKEIHSQSHPPELSSLLEGDTQSACYDCTKELKEIKNYLLVLFKFTVCTTSDCTQNLRSFVVLLHDSPLRVEKTELYSRVKKWKNPSDVRDSISAPYSSLPPISAHAESKSSQALFFSQSFNCRPQEKVRVLCWGECKERYGFFSFSLPEAVSTRFISLVATGVHSFLGHRQENVDVMKFTPHGAIVPIL